MRKVTPHYADVKGAIVDVPGVGILLAYGASVPTDGTAGYATGCRFAKTNGGAGTSSYVNEGTVTSCNFNAVAGA